MQVSSIAENGNTFQMCFYSLRSKLCQDESNHNTIHVIVFVYYDFLKKKCFLSKWIRAYNLVPFRI